MNQILVTGDEKVKRKKEKKVLPTKGIVSFYAICIIVLGICMISGSVYARDKINSVIEENTKPQVEINRDDDNNTIEINANHIRAITKITYRWNDEEENILYEGENNKNISQTIDLIGGTNKLSVSITEENGQTVVYENTYTVNIPQIKLEAVSNGVKIIVDSKTKIDYIAYNWDNNEKQEIEVKEKTYEGTIEAPKGRHILKIEIVDINGTKVNKEQEVVGDTEPTLIVKPQYVNGQVAFVIKAEDDENIIKVEITHNGGTKEIIDVNDKTFHKDIIMTKGETNTLIVTVINENGLQVTARKKFDNK